MGLAFWSLIKHNAVKHSVRSCNDEEIFFFQEFYFYYSDRTEQEQIAQDWKCVFKASELYPFSTNPEKLLMSRLLTPVSQESVLICVSVQSRLVDCVCGLTHPFPRKSLEKDLI